MGRYNRRGGLFTRQKARQKQQKYWPAEAIEFILMAPRNGLPSLCMYTLMIDAMCRCHVQMPCVETLQPTTCCAETTRVDKRCVAELVIQKSSELAPASVWFSQRVRTDLLA